MPLVHSPPPPSYDNLSPPAPTYDNAPSHPMLRGHAWPPPHVSSHVQDASPPGDWHPLAMPISVAVVLWVLVLGGIFLCRRRPRPCSRLSRAQRSRDFPKVDGAIDNDLYAGVSEPLANGASSNQDSPVLLAASGMRDELGHGYEMDAPLAAHVSSLELLLTQEVRAAYDPDALTEQVMANGRLGLHHSR